MAKIQIGKVATPANVKAQIEASGIEFGRDESGALYMGVKLPGVERLALTRADLDKMAAVLSQPVAEGDGPAAVFERSSQDTPDGGLTAKFSDAPRSRSVTFTATDRDEVSALFTDLADNWGEYAAQLAAAEEDADKGNADG
jgi:hypothetical protein